MAAQEELLGTSVDAHPLELVAGQVASLGALTTVEASMRVGQRVCVVGVRQSWRRTRTGRGETMAFLSLEDLDGMLDVTLPPEVYRRARTTLARSAQTPLLVTGIIEIDLSRGEPVLRAEKVVRLA
jgi:DNA polymerase-3 subunit alpha